MPGGPPSRHRTSSSTGGAGPASARATAATSVSGPSVPASGSTAGTPSVPAFRIAGLVGGRHKDGYHTPFVLWVSLAILWMGAAYSCVSPDDPVDNGHPPLWATRYRQALPEATGTAGGAVARAGRRRSASRACRSATIRA